MKAFPYQEIVPLYLEPQRKYHTLAHVHSLLRCIETIPGLSIYDKDVLLAVAWLHDAYYDPKAPAGFNETTSTRLVGQYLSSGVMDTDEFLDVVRAIDATKHHTKDQEKLSEIQKLFLDIDIHELGTEDYWTNEQLIRDEYVHVPLEQYLEGREKFLQEMLDRKTLFYTNVMRDRYEAKARENLAAGLNEIRQKKAVLLG